MCCGEQEADEKDEASSGSDVGEVRVFTEEHISRQFARRLPTGQRRSHLLQTESMDDLRDYEFASTGTLEPI